MKIVTTTIIIKAVKSENHTNKYAQSVVNKQITAIVIKTEAKKPRIISNILIPIIIILSGRDF